MEYKDFNVNTVQEKVRSAEDFTKFMRMLNSEIVKKDPEFRDRFLPDALEAIANWIRDTDPPEQADLGYVARLMVAAVYYN